MLGLCLLINLIQYIFISAPNNDTLMLTLKWRSCLGAQEICFDNSNLKVAAAAAIVMITSGDDGAIILTSHPDLI